MRMPRCVISGLCTAISVPMPLLAASTEELPVSQWNIVPEQTLAQMRGGMELGQLVASFAMDRVIEVNGAVVAQAHLVISNLDQLGKGGMPTINVSGPLAQVVQVLSSGAVNVISPPAPSAAGAATTTSAASPGMPAESIAAAPPSVPNVTPATAANATSTMPSATIAGPSNPSPSTANVTAPGPANSTPAGGPQASQGMGAGGAQSATAGATAVASTVGGPASFSQGQTVSPGNLPSNAAIGTIVQNSMNSAMIQAQTTISASLNSLGQLNSMTLANAIRQQVYVGH